MSFHECVHAYIAAKYYVCLTEEFGDRGKEAFIHATRYYAEQRGRRMAQRAIRDGAPLTFASYCRYGEWIGTEEIKAAGLSNCSVFLSYTPDAIQKITRCPWHHQFQTMGLSGTAGAEYCRHLDKAIARGFNPDLVYEVEQTLQTADCCIHRMKNPDFDGHTDLSRNPDSIRSFEFHCAHSFWTFREVTAAIFSSLGEQVNARVLRDFSRDYGQKMADTLMSYQYTNFNVCTSRCLS